MGDDVVELVEDELVDWASAGARVAAKASKMEVVLILGRTLRDSSAQKRRALRDSEDFESAGSRS